MNNGRSERYRGSREAGSGGIIELEAAEGDDEQQHQELVRGALERVELELRKLSGGPLYRSETYEALELAGDALRTSLGRTRSSPG